MHTPMCTQRNHRVAGMAPPVAIHHQLPTAFNICMQRPLDLTDTTGQLHMDDTWTRHQIATQTSDRYVLPGAPTQTADAAEAQQQPRRRQSFGRVLE